MNDTVVSRAGQVLVRGLLLVQGIGMATWVLVTVLLGSHHATTWLQVAAATVLCGLLFVAAARLGEGAAAPARHLAVGALLVLLVVQLVGAATTGPAAVPAQQWLWPALNAIGLLVLVQPVRRAHVEPAPLPLDS